MKGVWSEVLTFGEALRKIKKILGSNSSLALKGVVQGVIDSEAEQLMRALYQKFTGNPLSRLDLYMRAGESLCPDGLWDELNRLAHARTRGEPLQYLTGVQVFMDHEYQVGPGVLVPRPETEVLLTEAVAILSHLGPQWKKSSRLGLEVGTGSGVLSIELLTTFPKLTILASEFSPEAERYANLNGRKILGEGENGEGRFKILSVESPSEVLEPFKRERKMFKTFGPGADFLITNPPYLISPSDGEASNEVESQVMDFEPGVALFAPPEDPLYFYRKIADDADQLLAAEGWVFAEVPHERALVIRELFRMPKWSIRLVQDLNQRDRVLLAKLNTSQ